MQSFLQQINGPSDLKKLTIEQLTALCAEIRSKLVETVAHTGGHLSSNLGVVELTVALHYVLNCPQDQIVFDVGHQCYTHKLLTGRQAQFDSLRAENGLCGFPRTEEGPYDSFNCGHSSTSIAAAFGVATAKKLAGENCTVAALIGDGALTGGLAYEGMNIAGRFNGNFIVVLNDNKMSINHNVGAIARYLAVMRTRKGYRNMKSGVENTLLRIPLVGRPLRNVFARAKNLLKDAIYNSNMFEDMGFHYMGPFDGHDLPTLIRAFELAKQQQSPVVVHVCTQKGKGYSFAEKNPRAFHGIGGFDIETGEKRLSQKTFSDCFGEVLCALAEEDPHICAITAAMKSGTGLDTFAQKFPTRFFDVGIAEEGAVTFASGLAQAGQRPVFAVYSTFLQRSYDQLLHDTAMQRLKIVFAVDRAGFVGDDGESHQGLFDAAFLSTVPDMTIFSPTYFDELKTALKKAFYETKGACAVRYPRGLEPKKTQASLSGGQLPYDYLPADRTDTVIVTYGAEFSAAIAATEQLLSEGTAVSVLKLNQIWPIDRSAVTLVLQYDRILFFEEGIRSGGIGEHFGRMLLEQKYKGLFELHAVADCFVPQANTERQRVLHGLDKDAIVLAVKEGQNT